MERGIVISWGVGYFGQLGHGDDSCWDSPRMIKALEPRRLGSPVCQVVCGGSHSGALTEDHKIFTWGLNRAGQCGPSSLGRNSSARTDSSSNETMMEPKYLDLGDLLNDGRDSQTCVQYLVFGRNHSAFVTNTGRVFTWGEASFGRLGVADVNIKKCQSFPLELSFFIENPVHLLVSGDFHMLALLRDGNLYSWGYNADGQTGHSSLLNVRSPRRIDFFSGRGIDIATVSCGSAWSSAVTLDGRLFVWGYGDGGIIIIFFKRNFLLTFF